MPVMLLQVGTIRGAAGLKAAVDTESVKVEPVLSVRVAVNRKDELV